MCTRTRTRVRARTQEGAGTKGSLGGGVGCTVIILEPLPSGPIVRSPFLSLSPTELLRAPHRRRLTVAPFTYGNAHRLTRDGLVLIGLGGARRGLRPIGTGKASLSIVHAGVIDDDDNSCVARLGHRGFGARGESDRFRNCSLRGSDGGQS